MEIVPINEFVIFAKSGMIGRLASWRPTSPWIVLKKIVCSEWKPVLLIFKRRDPANIGADKHSMNPEKTNFIIIVCVWNIVIFILYHMAWWGTGIIETENIVVYWQ